MCFSRHCIMPVSMRAEVNSSVALNRKPNRAMSDGGSTPLEINRAKTSCYSVTALRVSRAWALCGECVTEWNSLRCCFFFSDRVNNYHLDYILTKETLIILLLLFISLSLESLGNKVFSEQVQQGVNYVSLIAQHLLLSHHLFSYNCGRATWS